MAATAAREGDFRRKAPLLAPAVLSVANFLLVLDGLMVTVALPGVPVALAAVAAAPRLLPGGASQSQPVRLDAGAALLSTSGLVLLVFGITNLERAGARPLITALALTAGCGLLVAFLVRERR